jgi:hypothetical protein
VEGFWWSLDITNFLSSLTNTLSNLIRTKRLPIIPLVCLYHHPKLWFMTRKTTHHFSQLIILILQAIHTLLERPPPSRYARFRVRHIFSSLCQYRQAFLKRVRSVFVRTASNLVEMNSLNVSMKQRYIL